MKESKMSTMFGITSVLVVAAMLTAVTPARGAMSYPGGTYAQDFDTLPIQTFAANVVAGRGPIAIGTAYNVGGVDGWFGGNLAGSSTSTEFRAQNGSVGSSSGRGIISYGTDNSTERALGMLPTGNQISSIGLVLQNTTGQTISVATLSFVGEQWRRGDVASPDSLLFDYLVSSDSNANIASTGFQRVTTFDFTSPNTQPSPTQVALDGNAAVNRQSISGNLTGLNWQAGTYLVLRWTTTEWTGQDDGLGIDTVRFTAVPEPATMSLLIVGGLGLIRRRRGHGYAGMYAGGGQVRAFPPRSQLRRLHGYTDGTS